MQTMKTTIRAIGSTSKGHGDRIILQSGPALGLGNHTFADPPPTPLRPSPWMLIRWSKFEFAYEGGLHSIRCRGQIR